jgi:hypothetical protein
MVEYPCCQHRYRRWQWNLNLGRLKRLTQAADQKGVNSPALKAARRASKRRRGVIFLSPRALGRAPSLPSRPDEPTPPHH